MTADQDESSGADHRPDGESDGGAAPPRFDVVAGGYDRGQVDEHIADLERTIARQRTELEQASGSKPAPDAVLVDGAKMAGLQGAKGLNPEMIGAFTSRLQSILQAAEEEADAVRDSAEKHARQEEERSRARLTDLEQRRTDMLDGLVRVRGQLDSLLAEEGAIGGPRSYGQRPPAAAVRSQPPPVRPESPVEQTTPGQSQPRPEPRTAPSPRTGDESRSGGGAEPRADAGAGPRPEQGRAPSPRSRVEPRPEPRDESSPRSRDEDAGAEPRRPESRTEPPRPEQRTEPSPRPRPSPRPEARPEPRPGPSAGRPEQGQRMGTPPSGDGNRPNPSKPSPAPRPGPAQDAVPPRPRPIPSPAPKAPGPGPAPGGPGAKPSPTPHPSTQQGASAWRGAPTPPPKPRPTPRPRPGAPSPGTPVPSSREAGNAAGRQARNGLSPRDNGSVRGDDPDGQSAFGTGAR